MKPKWDKRSKSNVIADGKKLIESYIAMVKERACGDFILIGDDFWYIK